MPNFSYESGNRKQSVKSMLMELKEVLEQETQTQTSFTPDDPREKLSDFTDVRYFTFLGSKDDGDIIVRPSDALEKKYSSEKLGEFFKIQQNSRGPIASRLKELKTKSTRCVDLDLKRKISDKIFKL